MAYAGGAGIPITTLIRCVPLANTQFPRTVDEANERV
jgi:hypothetical protein